MQKVGRVRYSSRDGSSEAANNDGQLLEVVGRPAGDDRRRSLMRGGDGDAVEDDGLDCEAGAEAEEDAPVEALAGGGAAVLGGALAHLVEDEEHAGARHVAILSQDVAGGTEPGLVDASLGLDHVQYGRAARVRHPEDGVPVRYA